MACLGQAAAGHALILEGYALDMKVGMLRGRSGVLGYATEALILDARWSEALALLDEALALAARMGERLHLPELLLLRARIARGQGDAAAGRAALHAALGEAASQQALWLELQALAALCEDDSAQADDFIALAAARARLGEGLDTTLVARIDTLLRRHGPDRSPTAA
jgi:hypothetical protein